MTEEKAYTLRELEGDDLFLMINIVSKIGLDRLKGCMEAASVKKAIGTMMDEKANAADKEAALNSVGMLVIMEVASAVLERLPDCKEEIYTLLASVSGKTRDDIAHMKLIPLTRMIKEFFKKPEFPDFFTEVYGFFS